MSDASYQQDPTNTFLHGIRNEYGNDAKILESQWENDKQVLLLRIETTSLYNKSSMDTSTLGQNVVEAKGSLRNTSKKYFPFYNVALKNNKKKFKKKETRKRSRSI